MERVDLIRENNSQEKKEREKERKNERTKGNKEQKGVERRSQEKMASHFIGQSRCIRIWISDKSGYYRV